MDIKKFNEFNESNSIEDITEYELKIKNMYSDLEKGVGDGILDLGPIGAISKTVLNNIRKTYPDSKIIEKDGRYLLSVKENTYNDICEKIIPNINKDEILLKEIDDIAKKKLNNKNLKIYNENKNDIIDELEERKNIIIFENQKYMKAFENIYYDLKYIKNKIGQIENRLDNIENRLDNIVQKNNLKE